MALIKTLPALLDVTVPAAGRKHSPVVGKMPKILTIDIETSPNIAYTWGMWDQNISVSQLIEPTRILCFAAKWHGSATVEFYSEHHDSPGVMLQRAWELLDEADIVVSYNGPAFDIKHLNRAFITAGMTPPSPFKNVDLLKTSRSQFKFPSNKLDYVARELEVGRKVQHQGQELWNGVLNGDPKAWATMKKYNIQDVKLTEDLFDVLGPWIKGMPNVTLWTGVPGCHRCGSTNLTQEGWYRTPTRTYPRNLCNDCGAWSRGTLPATTATETRAI